MIRDPLANSIVNADSCTVATGRPKALYSCFTLARKSSPDCRCVGLSNKHSEPGSSNAVLRVSAAATVDLPDCLLANRRMRSEGERSKVACQGSAGICASVSNRAGSALMRCSAGGSCLRNAVTSACIRSSCFLRLALDMDLDLRYLPLQLLDLPRQ